MKSTATAAWEGGLKDGKGTLTAASGTFKAAPYGFAKRFENAEAPGTTPEEMIAAAHAGCFSMATAAALEKAGFPPKRLDTEATVTMHPVEGKPTVTGSHLLLTATIPGISEAQFLEIANTAKAGCVISRLLNTAITLEAKLAK